MKRASHCHLLSVRTTPAASIMEQRWSFFRVQQSPGFSCLYSPYVMAYMWLGGRGVAHHSGCGSDQPTFGFTKVHTLLAAIAGRSVLKEHVCSTLKIWNCRKWIPAHPGTDWSDRVCFSGGPDQTLHCPLWSGRYKQTCVRLHLPTSTPIQSAKNKRRGSVCIWTCIRMSVTACF